ncbi:MAG: type II secretion system protein GspL [Henriciella sp.]|uniref:type II secretion system protein GspL n=1 Tax=Henriciella sp. TaxID=1968823 RepID=UPI0032ED97BF
MADLFILIPVREDDGALFAWRSGGDWVVDTAPPAGRSGRGDDAVAFVPGTAATVHHAEIAARKPVEARRIALFALEDDLAEPVEHLHAALGPAGEAAQRQVQVVSMEAMRRWVELLTEWGLPDADIVASHACLPEGRVAVEGVGECLFRRDQSVFALDATAPDDLIRSLAPEAPDFVQGHRLANLLDKEASAEAPGGAADWLVQLAGWYRDKPAATLVSLRQGDFSIRRPIQLEGLSRWRPVGALAASLAVLWLGSVWLETRALDNQATELRMQTNELVAAVAPDANGRLPEAMESLRREQKLAASSLRPTLVSAALYEAIAPVPNAQVRSLRYDAGSGRLTAMVVFDSYGDADEIGGRLEEKGLAVRLGEARQTGNRVMGEFAIEAGS